MVVKKNSKNRARVPRKRPQMRVKRQPFLKTVMAPAAYGAVQGSKARDLAMVTSGGRTLVKNFEQVSAFPTSSSGAFNVGGAPANPGLSASFPWLSGIAQNYQKFRFLQLRWFYSSTCSTATPGRVFIQASYDFEDNAPASVAQALSSDDSSAGPSWFGSAINGNKAFELMSPDNNVYVDVDVARMAEPWYYVRDTAITQSSGGSISAGAQTFTPGAINDPSAVPVRVFYGSEGVTNGVSPGVLYVSYIIELCEPIATAQGV
jgi:hypothetical protein